MVRGCLKFEKLQQVLADQHVMVIVEDTACTDIDSVKVAHTVVLLPENFDFEHDLLPFEINIDSNSDTLLIRAHMPIHPGTDIRLGDMISTIAIPVHSGSDVVIPLHLVE